jgi:hypothetical protein
MSPLRSRQSSIACVLLSLYLPACTSTRVVAAPSPAQLVEAARPPSIHGMLNSGTNFSMLSPLVSGDSLVGTVGSGDASRTISLPLSEIRTAGVQDGGGSWQVGMPTPAKFVEAKHPRSIAITLVDGGTLKLKSPMIRGDSLVGSVWSEDAAPSTGVPLNDVAAVSVRKIEAGKTILLVLGIPLTVVALLVLISAGQ